MNFKDKVLNKESGLIFYSFAPPKISTEEAKLDVIANRQIEQLSALEIDALILYDIQDESLRTNEERTFPYIPTVPPSDYAKNYLTGLKLPKIIYKSIANHTKEMFHNWLVANRDLENVVFVGASSPQQVEDTNFSLTDAYNLRQQSFNHLLLGGVTIPERHRETGDEHKRLFTKKERGCSFFVSQCVYSITEAKNLLSDYFYFSSEKESQMAPIIFTLSPCGSFKTLKFMQWLGIDVPNWLYNDLKHSKDILEASIRTSVNIAEELLDFSIQKGIPIGFNIESVSIRKEEIEASIKILNEVLVRVIPTRRAMEVQPKTTEMG